MQLQSFDDVLVDQLDELLSAERRLVQALPMTVNAASAEKLRTAGRARRLRTSRAHAAAVGRL